jgi:hypothetical protein
MFTMLFRAVAVVSVAVTALAVHPPVTHAQELPVQTVDQYSFSGLTQRRFEVITTTEDWEALWAQTHALVLQPPPLPQLDFTEEMVIAVASGEQSTGGHAITITRVLVLDETLEVWVDEALPAHGQFVSQALCQPYHFVRVPRVTAGPRFIVNHITPS